VENKGLAGKAETVIKTKRLTPREIARLFMINGFRKEKFETDAE
jgi:hypothetical protein